MVPSRADALLIVDVQNDFLPGGSLGVRDGDAIIPVLNDLIARFRRAGALIVATRDWHPADHCSFRAQGGPWPPHCVASTEGAAFAENLDLPPRTAIVSKATLRERDAYSAFDGTDLDVLLRSAGIERVFVGGLGTDSCVRASVEDALRHGFEVHVIEEAIRAVDVQPGDGRRAIEAMRARGAHVETLTRKCSPASSPLLTDFYQLAMLQAYGSAGLNDVAVFELSVRRLPEHRAFLVSAGLEQAIDYLEQVRFSDEDVAWLAASGRFDPHFVEGLREWRFTGDVDAVPEGTIVFAGEPLLRVVAPLPEAQLVESRLINILHLQTLVASKAARCVLAAGSRTLVDFSMRRAHGAEAALYGARASYLAGFAGTATVQAGQRFGIPLHGTMAHSFVQAHATEREAFVAFARAFPGHATLLIDTYDTLDGARLVAALAPELRAQGIEIRGVRIDSGDLGALAREVRSILDAAGERAIGIFASGNLDEHAIAALEASRAPIAGYGVGTLLGVSAGAPMLDMVYKLVEYGGGMRRKRSQGKESLPGRKQVYRRYDSSGHMLSDEVALAGELAQGEPLLRPVMRGGRRTVAAPTLAEVQEHHAQQRQMLPPGLRLLEGAMQYPVTTSAQLRALVERSDETAAAGA
jgi:nicotinate phosphoribosyltransferase